MQAYITKNKDAYLQRYRFYHKKYTYGIDGAEFERLYNAQSGKWAICKVDFPPLSQRAKTFAVDHDHATGAVRSLLCIPCNSAVAMVKENIAIAEELVLYLKRHKPSAGLAAKRDQP